MTPAAILGVVVGAASFFLTFAAVLVQLGRVLQRADHVEAAQKATDAAAVAAEKAADAAVAALKEELRAQERTIQAMTARLDGLNGDHVRSAEKVSELRAQFHEMLRTLTSLREDIVGRLARIESYVEHHSSPPPQPSGSFGPPRRPTMPGGRSSGTHSVAGATTVRWSQVSVRNLGSGG